MKISFITTIYNEEKTIKRFLDSVCKQTKLPDEIIIVDGGSTDATESIISNYTFPILNKKIRLIKKAGNRSVGRNEAIRQATGDIIVCSDSGNVLDKAWIKEIVKPFILNCHSERNEMKSRNLIPQKQNFNIRSLSASWRVEMTDRNTVDVVAGYYKGLAKNVFQKCLIPYALVMPNKVDPNTFLPATRSIAFTKAIWKKVGGFDERFSHNEDYVFAKKLKKIGANIVFQKKAVVYWIPRNTIKQAFVMFWRFAYGDAEAKIYRPKVAFLFLRYIIGFFLLVYAMIVPSFVVFTLLWILLMAYILWAIFKNYRYVNNWKAIYYLPLLQFTADVAVLSGTIMGGLKIKCNFMI